MDKDHFNKNREGYFGWFGYGGSIMQWHPELKIGFAFVIFEKFKNIILLRKKKIPIFFLSQVPTFLNVTERFNDRGAVLQEIVKECVQNEKLKNSD